MPHSYLAPLGVYGFEPVEPVILAALVTEDPLLLVGPCGTGKTYLLNSLSEALGLEHRHYNASLIAFDDLVGFPFPDDERSSVHYLETPATVWGAESVLVDEINRCRPEHQNRLFSLVHERRIQGLKLERLRFRWAAMNPASLDQRPGDSYSGAEPLDMALADRFAFVVDVADWADLSDEDQALVADPRGDGRVSDDGGALAAALGAWRRRYETLLSDPPEYVVGYARRVAGLLGQSGLRISPRRARQIARSLLGLSAVRGAELGEDDARLILRWSLPHRAWGQQPAEEALHGAHRIAWDATFADGREKWLHDFLSDPRMSGRARRLFRAPDADTCAIAVARALAGPNRADNAAFAFALYPAAVEGRLAITREGLTDLARLAKEVLHVNGTITWQEPHQWKDTTHPELVRHAQVTGKLRGGRKERAIQIFHWCLVREHVLPDPAAFENEFNETVKTVRSHAESRRVAA